MMQKVVKTEKDITATPLQMAKQRGFSILQSKCDLLVPFATHFFESAEILDTARIAGRCD